MSKILIQRRFCFHLLFQPFSTTNFKPIDSLRDFVGKGFSSGASVIISSEEESDESDEDDYDYDGENNSVYAGLKFPNGEGDEDYEDRGRNVKYDYMYEVRKEVKSLLIFFRTFAQLRFPK